MSKNRPGHKTRNCRNSKPSRAPERNCMTDGVYSNNYFMHAATSHVGTVVKVETVQGAIYEGIFKTFSHDFDVVLELAHKIDVKEPQKLNASDVIENLIFPSKDIVNMCAQNIDPEYAFSSNTFQIDSCISKFNGEISGEKDLQPWEDPALCNGSEEFDLENTDTTQNGWDVNEMFTANEKFGVQTSYDDSLADYTCQINRKDTKDFKEDEAKAARIAMEIERNPCSQSRSLLENGDNEEDLFAAVSRPGNDNDGSKYIPPARRNNQHHRVSGGNAREKYSPNGNQRYNLSENAGRPPKNAAATQSRYQTSQQYHSQAYGQHPPNMRDGGNRASLDNKNNQMCPSNVPQPQNIASYSANMHGQRSYPTNVVPVTNHSQNVSLQQTKSQRTSPISVNTMPNGNADYQPKSLPPISQSPPHQYHNQNHQPPNNGSNVANAQQQRKHHQAHHHHTNSRGREDQINELKKFGSDFNLSYDMKNKDADGMKQIQVVTNRNKSPPVSQNMNAAAAAAATERNVVAVTIVPTLPPNKYTPNGPATAPQPMMGAAPPAATNAGAHPQTGPVPPSQAVSVTTTQVAMKQHPLSMPQPGQYQSSIHLQQRDAQVLLQHQPHLQQQMAAAASPHASHHPQAMPPPPQQQPILQHKQKMHQVAMHQATVMAPQSPVQIQQHPATTPQQTKTVITVQSTPAAAVANVPQQQVVTQSTVPQQGGVTPPQAGMVPLNVHSRPPMQQQPSQKSQTSSTPASSEMSSPPSAIEGGSDSDSVKGKDSDASVEDATQRVKNVRLNPDAKEYIPAVKSFTPVSRSPSTPTQSRPHTPQTPSSYSIHPGNAPVATGIQMIMPGHYVVTASPGYVPAPQAQNRIRKAPVNAHRTSEFHPSNIPVSAVTGQPLLAPPVPIAQSHIGHGTSFSVPAYTHHPQLAAASHYSPLPMLRMVQHGGVVPLVPSTLSYHDSSGTNATAVYVNQGSSAAVAMAQHTPHVHHPQQHPPPSTAPSPSQTPQGPSQSHTPNSYQHPPLAAQSASPYTPIMCPVIQAPPTHGPPHHMVAAQAQSHAMQQYMTQHPSVTQQPHILSIIPHSCT